MIICALINPVHADMILILSKCSSELMHLLPSAIQQWNSLPSNIQRLVI